MDLNTQEYDVGVIVGRFQVHDLHKGHVDLISHVCERHKKVIVILGVSPIPTSPTNPLDFEARKQMLLTYFPQLNVLYLKDVGDDAVWSQHLDNIVGDMLTPSQTCVLYGGRDSFLKVYTGKYPSMELVQEGHGEISGTEIRRQLRREVIASPDFRAGVIWAACNRFPVTYPTVDIALFRKGYSEILLGRKLYEKQWRLIGGFADPASECYEHDAIRELMEETGLETQFVEYIGSHQIDDWRYRSGPDKIKTLLFGGIAISTGPSEPSARDDIAEVEWRPINALNISKHIIPNHQQLVFDVLQWSRKKVG